MLESPELVARIVLAAALGGLLGLERELSEHAAGLRTHMLVCLGAALFTLVGAYGAGENAGVDPTRVAAQVVTGIGFLGAGAIIQQGVSVKGLTTAASLWVTASIGTGVGLGFYLGAVVTTTVALAALLALKPIEKGLVERLARRRSMGLPDD